MTPKGLIVGIAGGIVLGLLMKKLAMGLLLGIVTAFLLYRAANKTDEEE